MTETIQQLKEDIAILQEKLQKLEELQRTKSPAEEAFKRVYYRYPDKLDVEHGCWDIFEKGYNTSKDDCKSAKEDCKVVEEPKPEREFLCNVMRNLGYSVNMCDEIVDAVRCWLPEPQSSSGSQNVDVELLVDGFNDCLKKIKDGLG
jgi:hypothetical protein